MKNAFRFLVVATLAAISWTTNAQEAKITGYPLGEFAVKGDIKSQLTTNVVQPLRSTLSRTPNAEVSISIVGYADQTGTGAKNDVIGSERADDAKSFLLENFPKATITSRSGGDEQNSRMVEVSWKIADAPAVASPPPPQKNGVSETTIVISSASAFAIALGGILFILTRNRKPESVQLALAPAVAAPAAQKPEPRYVHFKKDGYLYIVPILERDGRFHTPFPEPNASRTTFGDIKKAVRGALTISLTESAIEAMVANGTIKKEKSHEKILVA
jgi:hypothetical protein